METVTFNGIAISDFYQVAGVIRPITGRTNSTQAVSGMDGVMLTGSAMTQNRVTVILVMSDMNVMERREAVRKLSFMLHTDSLAKLSIGSDGGPYYMAILDGEVPFVEHVRSGRVEVNFATEEPMLYGKTVTRRVPSQGSLRVMVGGTYPARPRIVGEVTGDPTNGLWGLRLDEADHIRVDTMSDEPRDVSIDCDGRTAYVEGALTLPTLDSDWIELSAGMHTLRNDVGSGGCTVSWQERWV